MEVVRDLHRGIELNPEYVTLAEDGTAGPLFSSQALDTSHG